MNLVIKTKHNTYLASRFFLSSNNENPFKRNPSQLKTKLKLIHFNSCEIILSTSNRIVAMLNRILCSRAAFTFHIFMLPQLWSNYHFFGGIFLNLESPDMENNLTDLKVKNY